MATDFKLNAEFNDFEDGLRRYKDPLDATYIKSSTKSKEYNTEDATEGEKDVVPPSISYFSLYRYSTSTDKIMLVVAFLSAVITGCVAPVNTLIFAELTQSMVYYGLLKENITALVPDDFDFAHDITLFALRNIGLGCILFVFSYLSTTLSNYTAHNQIFTIRKRFLEAALNQDIAYYDLNSSGDFASRMTDDLLKLEDGIGEKSTTCFHYWVSFISCVVLALARGWRLALVCLASFPITLISVGTVGVVSSRLSKKESRAYGVAGAIAEEVLSGIRTVVAFGGQQKEVLRYRDNLVDAKNINIKRNLFTGIGIGVLFLSIYCTYALSFWYGVGLVIDGTYNTSVMVSVFFGVLMGTMNFGMSTPFIEIFGMAKGAGAKVFSVIENIPIIDPLAERGEIPTECIGNLSFKNVFFNYPSRPDTEILKGLNLDIKSGETVAIVGGSGCGKSTCIQLVQRFYDPLQGSVTLDDKDLRELSVTWLRSKIGVVGQEPVLFNTTIGENIRYGLESATKTDIENAARQSNAHDFIKTLPEGYETLVGERGTQLSGGQKQRIAIARALVRNPKILLLDEATSALDNTSEAKVQKALDKAGEGRTTIIVAHRLSTIRNADVIIALHEGKVVEQGSHEQLMSLNGHYYKLVMAQIGPKADENDILERRKDRTISIMSDRSEEEDKIPDTQVLPDEDDIPVTLPLWKIIRLNKPDWQFVTLACFCSFLMGSAMPVFSVLFGEIIGEFGKGDPDKIRETTDFFCMIFVITGFITGTATFLSIFMFGIAGERMTMRLRGDAFEAMLNQEIGYFDDKRNATGALCARLSGEASAVQGATGQRVGTIIQSMATLVLAISLSIFFEWRLGLVALSFMPFTLGATVMHKQVIKSESFGSSKAMERSTKLAVDVIGSIRTVASLGREKMFVDQFVRELEPAMIKAKKNTHYRGLVYGIARSLIFFAFAASIYYGGYLIINEGVEYFNVLRVSQALILATISVANALTFAPNMQKGIQSASNILHLMNRIPKILDPQIATNGTYETKGEVKYEGVDFAYPTRPYLRVLNNLGLTIEPGKTVALVGASGCGKSTCIQLLERFYDPSNGQVLLDDKPINELMLNELRRNLGIVSQEPILFDRTIGENIAYGDNSREVTQQEIIEAAMKANIHKFITSLPMGYETSLGTKGAQLSGGQKQRVAIARALLRNPRVLLLDEATSALDTESEKVVQEALDQAKIGRTCITIAHRLTTIKDADLICVFNEGRIAESGTHGELLHRRGIYYKLYTQSSKTV